MAESSDKTTPCITLTTVEEADGTAICHDGLPLLSDPDGNFVHINGDMLVECSHDHASTKHSDNKELLNDSKKWSHASILILIEQYKLHESQLKSVMHKKKQVWDKIASEIAEQTGQRFTWSQVESKWKNLTKKFRDVVDHNNKSGNSSKTCSYYAELQEVYGFRPSVKPVALAAVGTVGQPQSTNAESPNVESPTVESPITKQRKSGKSPCKRKNSNPVLETLKRMHEDVKIQGQKRLQAEKEMHEQKMKLFGEFLKVMKKD